MNIESSCEGQIFSTNHSWSSKKSYIIMLLPVKSINFLESVRLACGYEKFVNVLRDVKHVCAGLFDCWLQSVKLTQAENIQTKQKLKNFGRADVNFILNRNYC
jgi:hypothetical protein